MAQGAYTRGERLLFYCGDAVINATSTLLLGLAYLVLGFAGFAALSGALSYTVYHEPLLGGALVRFGGRVLLFLAGPTLGLTCLFVFLQQAWRWLWHAPAVFIEKRLHPAFLLLLALGCGMLTAAAHATVEGRWSAVPTHLTAALETSSSAPGASPVEVR